MHLKTCFDNIVRLDIPDGIDIVAMNSIEQEKIPFEKKPRVKGLVE